MAIPRHAMGRTFIEIGNQNLVCLWLLTKECSQRVSLLTLLHYITPICAFVMGNNKLLSSDIIGQIVTLHKTGYQIKEIIKLLGVRFTTMKKCILEFMTAMTHPLKSIETLPGPKEEH